MSSPSPPWVDGAATPEPSRSCVQWALQVDCYAPALYIGLEVRGGKRMRAAAARCYAQMGTAGVWAGCARRLQTRRMR